MLRGVGRVAQLVSPQLVASCSWEVVTRLLQAAHQPTPALLLLRPAQVGRGEVGVAGVEGVVEGRDHGEGAAPGGAVVHGGRGGGGGGAGGGGRGRDQLGDVNTATHTQHCRAAPPHCILVTNTQLNT